MRTLREWGLRLWGTLTRTRTDRDLEDELRSHLALAADEARRTGTPAEETVRTARLRFGGVTQSMEPLRDRRGLPWLEDLGIDVRHGLRALRRTPVFAAVTILTLAVGIGANTAILSIVNGVLLRPLPYSRPEQLMYVTTERGPALSVAEYLEFQQFNRSFAHVGAFRTGEANLSVGDRALRVRSAFVDAHLLNALGYSPVQGRLFTVADSVVSAPGLPGGDSATTAPVALISQELWQSVLGAGQIVGRRIDVDGRQLEVIGVLPLGAGLMDLHTDIWMPLGFPEQERLARNNHNLFAIGRLKDGVTLASAQGELSALVQTWSARTGLSPGPGHAGHVFVPPGAPGFSHVPAMTPLANQILGRAGRSIWVLQAAVGLLLLIACANIANLLIGRAETRRREFALLSALGARRGRLLRKVATEGLLLALAGGALGVLLARSGVDALVRAYPTSLPRISEVAVDPVVMLLSLAIAVACGLLFGLAPLTHTRSSATPGALGSGARGSTGPGRHVVRRGLVIAETALAVIVVVGAGLLVRTVHNLTTVDTGFDRTRLITFSVTLPRASFDNLARVRAFHAIVEAMRKVPGVAAAAAMASMPLDRPLRANQTEMANSTAPMASIAPIDYQRVTSDIFETTGIPILRGRGFDANDASSRVAVVNETLANRYWNGRDPIGQQLRPGGTMPWLTVVGVAKDVKQVGVDEPVGAEAYVLIDQVSETLTSFLSLSPTTMHVVVRTAQPLPALAPSVARVVRNIDPSVPVTRLREMDDVFAESIRRPRLLADLLGLFSAIALLLAAIGTYGVLASMVAERRRDIGVRLALGANRGRLLAEVMTRGVALAGAGVALGLLGALGATRLLASLLFGVQPTDVTTLAIVTPSILALSAISCLLPAWRASRLDPVVVLRSE
jgi:putative ABC transport system permease protein